MKKIILATSILVALATSAFANMDAKLLSNLKKALKTASDVKWATKSDYTTASFSYNSQTFSAYYDADNELIGFGRQLGQDELPAAGLETIAKKYRDWTIDETMMFIDEYGNINYFASVKKGKNRTALKIAPNGHVNVYSRMPS